MQVTTKRSSTVMYMYINSTYVGVSATHMTSTNQTS